MTTTHRTSDRNREIPMSSTSAPQRLVVMGQGYVGLPLTMRALDVGFEVVGFDVDEARVERLRTGRTFIDDVTDDDVRAALATGRFLPTTAEADLAEFDVAVVTVPTPLRDGAPDLTYVEAAAALLAPHI